MKPREAELERHGVAAPQLALLHLALAATTSASSTSTTSTSINWAMGAHPVRCRRHGRPPGPHQPRVRQHLRPLRRSTTSIPNGVHVHEHVPPDRRLREQRLRDHRRHQGDAGTASPATTSSTTGKRSRFRVEEINPYVQEHIDLVASIRDGKPLNELKTGRREHPDGHHGPDVGLHRQGRHLGQALNSKQNLLPETLEFGPLPTPPVAVPGETALI